MTVKLILVVLVLAVVSSSLAQQTSRSRGLRFSRVRQKLADRLLNFRGGQEDEVLHLHTLTALALCRVPMDGPTTEITRTKYRYEFFPWISSSSQLIVDVRGDRDANIMFCPCDGCDGYRVLIGGWNNQKSFIRDNEDDPNLQTLVDTPDILSTTEYRRFIINLITTPTEFKIEVRKDGECVSFLERSWEADSKPWPMPSYIAFSGYTDNPMDFIFPALESWNGNCVRDSSSPRLLPTNAVSRGLDFPSNTPARCIAACNDQGFLFAGVQTGKECWCGNDAPPEDRLVPQEECNQGCSGDSAQICGGAWRMNVYRVD